MVSKSLPSDEAAIVNLRRDLALQLSRAVKKLGLTQSVAATRLNLPQPTLSKIINGQTDSLSIEFLIRVAIRAGVSLTLLFSDVPEEAGAHLTNRNARSSTRGTSRLADEARDSIEAANRRLTPSQRLQAFLEHNQLLAELNRAGRKTA
jgi:transcriptional regulator with XRE-family HTH domain